MHYYEKVFRKKLPQLKDKFEELKQQYPHFNPLDLINIIQIDDSILTQTKCCQCEKDGVIITICSNMPAYFCSIDCIEKIDDEY